MLITAVSTQLLWQLSSTVASHKTPCPFNPQSPTKGHMNYTVLNVYTWFTRLKSRYFEHKIILSVYCN